MSWSLVLMKISYVSSFESSCDSVFPQLNSFLSTFHKLVQLALRTVMCTVIYVISTGVHTA